MPRTTLPASVPSRARRGISAICGLSIAAIISTATAATALGAPVVRDPGTGHAPQAVTIDPFDQWGGPGEGLVDPSALMADGPAHVFATLDPPARAGDARPAATEGRTGSAPRPKPVKPKVAPKPVKPKVAPKPVKPKVAPRPVAPKTRAPAPRPVAKRTVAPRPAFSGSFRWPVPGGRISRGYAGSHHGLDIYAPHGTPVVASAGGKVVFAGWRYGGGYNVWIEHRPGLYTAYAHLSRIYARVGSMVAAGQRIGAVGATGWATGPHLHLEVWSGGYPGGPDRRVDPLRYVRR